MTKSKAMNRPTYNELLKDGRWQRKRLEIMQRDGFICRECGTPNNLNVHHIRYINGRKPWEYDDDNLITLCGSCHKKTHDDIKDKERSFEEYIQMRNRLFNFENLLIYYKKIGDFDDVITSFHGWHIQGNEYYNASFFYTDVYPIELEDDEQWWKFSLSDGFGFHFHGDIDACKEVMKHIFYHTPDKVLPISSVVNLRHILDGENNLISPDDFFQRNLLARMYRIINDIEERCSKLDLFDKLYVGL